MPRGVRISLCKIGTRSSGAIITSLQDRPVKEKSMIGGGGVCGVGGWGGGGGGGFGVCCWVGGFVLGGGLWVGFVFVGGCCFGGGSERSHQENNSEVVNVPGGNVIVVLNVQTPYEGSVTGRSNMSGRTCEGLKKIS